LKILIVCSGTQGRPSPFIREQAEALINLGCSVEYFLVKKKGVTGYLKAYAKLKGVINTFHPDLIHAHYGLSGLMANLQRKVPVVVTYHGSDINTPWVRRLSKISMKLARKNIFVSKTLAVLSGKTNPVVIPCGVDLETFKPVEKKLAREKMGLTAGYTYILFSSSFDNPVKNYPLAMKAIEMIASPDIKLVELKGYSREEVSCLMNAADVALMTSVTEGSPQFIKEAMACNVPIVSTDIGDVKELIGSTTGCFIAASDPEDVANKLLQAISLQGRTNGREQVLPIDNKEIAVKLLSLYNRVLLG